MPSLSKHFMITKVSAFLGTETMVDILKQVGAANWDSERLNMSVNTPARWSAHAEDAARDAVWASRLWGLTRLNVLLTSATEKESRLRRWHCILKAGKHV